MDKAHSKIAVLMATCNGERFIEAQLASLFAQTYTDFTLYIADDVSTDGTVEAIRAFQARYPGKIELQINAERLGAVKNFEGLLQRCREPYAAFCDQDDIWEPEKLRLEFEAMQALEHEGDAVPCLVHSDLTMMDEQGKERHASYFSFRGYRLRDGKDLGHILGPSGVMGNTVMINAALRARALPFPTGLEVHDYWLGIVAELYGRRRTLRPPLVRYRVHGGNVSNSVQRLQKGKRQGRWFGGDIRLPYLETQRRGLMEHLLMQKMDAEDKKIVQAFYDYLRFSKSRLGMYGDLIRYSLVKRGLWFRTKLLFKMLWTRRYRRA
jgi:glycosyltransferase involved in cell wall biosynthesis